MLSKLNTFVADSLKAVTAVFAQNIPTIKSIILFTLYTVTSRQRIVREVILESFMARHALKAVFFDEMFGEFLTSSEVAVTHMTHVLVQLAL